MPKGKFTPFTEKEENFIKENYLNLSLKRIGKYLGVSPARIQRFLAKNNLTIPEELRLKRIRDSYFKNGQTPYNKGLKQEDYMSLESIEKTKTTRFRKGHKSHNLKPIGTISEFPDRTGGYLYIKTAKNKWELYHRYIFKKNKGEIPEGFILTFKDGNRLNVKIENLELITRQENALRYSRHNFPKEIIPALILTNKIVKKIKTLQNGTK